MHVILRTATLVNAGVWSGSGLFLTAIAGPTLFSPSVVALVGRQHAGQIAQAMLAKYFLLQFACAAAAVVGLWLTTRTFRCRHLRGLLSLLALVAAGGFWLQPKLVRLNQQRYAAPEGSAAREAAAKEFGKWHGVSQLGNLVMLAGAFTHLAVLARGRRYDLATASAGGKTP